MIETSPSKMTKYLIIIPILVSLHLDNGHFASPGDRRVGVARQLSAVDEAGAAVADWVPTLVPIHSSQGVEAPVAEVRQRGRHPRHHQVEFFPPVNRKQSQCPFSLAPNSRGRRKCILLVRKWPSSLKGPSRFLWSTTTECPCGSASYDCIYSIMKNG